jgi:Holliday junction resolvase RusA-like endonuclease
MTQELFIPYRFPSLNEYIAAMNRNRFIGNKMKRDCTHFVHQTARYARLGHFTEPITISLTYWEPNARRDPDNITFAKKFILDGLKEAGVITDDSQKWIKGIDFERWYVAGKEDRIGVFVQMKEVGGV